MFPEAFGHCNLARMRQPYHRQIPLGTKRAQDSNNPVVQSVCRLGIDTLAIRGRQFFVGLRPGFKPFLVVTGNAFVAFRQSHQFFAADHVVDIFERLVASAAIDFV